MNSASLGNVAFARSQTVHSTISQDFAQGKLAREAAALQNLGAKTSPGQHLATDKGSKTAQQIPRQTSEPAAVVELSPRELREQRGRPNLKDYQMQLMLLEQQNKKRLLMARQEQDGDLPLERKEPHQPEIQNPIEVQLAGDPIPKSGTAWQGNMDSTTAADRKRQLSNDISGPACEKRPKRMKDQPYTVSTGNSTSFPNKEPHGPIPRDITNQSALPIPHVPGYQVPKATIAPKPAPAKISRGKAQPPKERITPLLPQNFVNQSKLDPHFRILHQVVCSGHFHSGKGNIFSSPPSWTLDKSKHLYDKTAHLDGEDRVHNIPDYINKSGNIAFLVFIYYRCKDASRWDHAQKRCQSTTDLRYKEAIGIVSAPLQEIIDGLSRCKSEPGAYYPKYSASTNTKDSEDAEADEYSTEFFYHHRHALAAALPEADRDVQIQLSALLRYITSTQGQRFAEIDALVSQSLIQAHNIPMLFCPNDIVITKPGGVLTACVLRAWPTGRSVIGLECWAWGYDGHWLHRKQCHLGVNRPVQPVVRIQDLEVYPARFATEEDIQYLRSRGEKFWSLRYQSFVAYEGWDFKADQFYTNESRWMIDYKTYRQMHPQADPFSFGGKGKVSFDRWPDVISHTAQLDHENLLILPPQIHGFSFKKKNWNSLIIDNIRPVKWNKEAFDRLVLPAKIKDMVKSLVMVRASTRESKQRRVLDMMRDDIIAGKGNGLIMLLHGGPGTGKTLTAESVAELAEMPLYSVTCGDIGTKPEVVENYLETVLMLGKNWNCVLLLDEADVFLEERSLADLERNSLVSVFLRTLEYYDGILILTSNRVGTFDAAFTSRIQVSLHYDTLNAPSRRRIWQNFFDMLRTDEEDVDLDDLLGHIDELVGYEMNGRQIRNVFTTARQLAVFKKETLVWDHMDQAIRSVCDFNRYLRKLHGHSEDQWARDERLR